MANLDGLTLKMLAGKDEETQQLQRWIDVRGWGGACSWASACLRLRPLNSPCCCSSHAPRLHPRAAWWTRSRAATCAACSLASRATPRARTCSRRWVQGWGGGGGGWHGVASQRLRRGCCTHQLGAAPSSQPRTPAPHSLPPTSLGPQYVFSFTYGEGGGVSMRLGAHGGRELSTHATDDLGRIKYETCRLMRMLVTITQSLEQARVRVSWAWQRGG